MHGKSLPGSNTAPNQTLHMFTKYTWSSSADITWFQNVSYCTWYNTALTWYHSYLVLFTNGVSLYKISLTHNLTMQVQRVKPCTGSNSAQGQTLHMVNETITICTHRNYIKIVKLSLLDSLLVYFRNYVNYLTIKQFPNWRNKS